MLRRCVLLLFALTLGACDGGGEEGPYFAFAGGGFVFNYRYAEATYGFVARVLRKPPAGGVRTKATRALPLSMVTRKS